MGVNCSLGPSELLPVVKKLVRMTDKPVIVQANAGLPDARLNYSVDAEEFAACAELFMDAGVRIVGGCCGTTPEYIRRIRELADRKKPAQTGYAPYAAVCSATRAVRIDGVRVIGERINPTGKKAMKRALIENDLGYVDTQALEQTEAGADILDVNAGLPDVDEKVMLERLVKRVQRVTDLPLQIDSTDPAAVERALRAYHGKAIVNSVSGDERSLREMLPLVKKYGAAVVALTVDSHGVPATVAARLKIAARIIREADKLGIPRTDIFVDCLTLTAGAEQAQAVNTLDAIRAVKKRYGVKTVLGVSNISFGLPCRKVINTAFLSAALWAGLDLPILNPNIPENMQTIAAFNVLSGADAGCAAYSEKYAGTEMTTTVTRTDAPERNGSSDDLGYCILKGLPESRAVAVRLLDGGVSPLALISDYVIPALNEVGELYERGKLFLPRLISAADSAKLCFEEVKKRLPAGERVGRGAIVMATVKGDVHDHRQEHRLHRAGKLRLRRDRPRQERRPPRGRARRQGKGRAAVRTVRAHDHHPPRHARDRGAAPPRLPRLPHHGGRRGAHPRVRRRDRRGPLLPRRQRGRAIRPRDLRRVTLCPQATKTESTKLSATKHSVTKHSVTKYNATKNAARVMHYAGGICSHGDAASKYRCAVYVFRSQKRRIWMMDLYQAVTPLRRSSTIPTAIHARLATNSTPSTMSMEMRAVCHQGVSWTMRVSEEMPFIALE